MQISGLLQIFLVGALGGLFIEILRWWKLRESQNLPAYASSPFYWGLTLLMIMAGGILAILYGTDQRNALMVANIGATAPALIGAFATKSKSVPAASKPQGGSTKSRVTRGASAETTPIERTEQIRQFLGFGG